MEMSHQQPNNAMEQNTGPNQILRIHESANELDELFRVVMGPRDSHVPLSVPMRQRTLPESFFRPPQGSSASHSRDSSLDASFSPPLSQPSSSPMSPSSPVQHSINGQLPHASALPINHSRAHSSPATFQQSLSVPNSQHHHLRQLSYDIESLPLPDGWEMAKASTGQHYYINHVDKSTTWKDPRQAMQQQLQRQLLLRQQRMVVLSTPNVATTLANNTNNNTMNGQNLVTLPEGWNEARTADGTVYYINHIERTTTWDDPRISKSQSQSESLNGGLNSPPPPPSFATATQSNLVGPSSLVTALQNMNTNGSMGNSNDPIRRNQYLENLERERQRMRQRQAEIFKNERILKSTLGDVTLSGGVTRLPPLSSTGIDPFLGGNNGALNNDCHSRQESADSGLGLGPNYSLPHTPEDFLSNIEDVVNGTGDDSNNNTLNRSNNDLGLDSLSQVANLDLGTETMESDDLVPSLPDLNPDLNALLESNGNNIMTWL